jgi:hypothetical protein
MKETIFVMIKEKEINVEEEESNEGQGGKHGWIIIV